MKLGAGIMQIPARTPAMTAMTAATLDLMSGGRVPARARHVGAAGGRGLARPAVRQAARAHARVRRDRPRRDPARRSSSTTATHYDDPVRGDGRDRPRQAAEADDAAAAAPRSRSTSPRSARRTSRSPPRSPTAGCRSSSRRSSFRDVFGERSPPREPGFDVAAFAVPVALTDDLQARPRLRQAAPRALRRRHGREGPELLQRPRLPLRLRGRGARRSRSSTSAARRWRRSPPCPTRSSTRSRSSARASGSPTGSTRGASRGVTTLLVQTHDRGDAADDGGAGRCEAERALRPLGQGRDRHRRRQRDRPPDGRPGSPRRAPTSSSARASRSAARRRPPSSSSSACARSACAATSATRPRSQAVVDRTRAELGRVDILVNNAGTVWGAPAEDHPLEGWQKVIDVNLTGVFLFAQAAGRVMIEQGGGKIVNIASVAAFGGAPPELMNAVAYNASKGGVVAFTRDLATKWARHGINVNAIAPGWFPSDMNKVLLDAQPDAYLRAHPAAAASAAPTTSRARSSSSPPRVGLRHRPDARRRRRPVGLVTEAQAPLLILENVEAFLDEHGLGSGPGPREPDRRGRRLELLVPARARRRALRPPPPAAAAAAAVGARHGPRGAPPARARAARHPAADDPRRLRGRERARRPVLRHGLPRRARRHAASSRRASRPRRPGAGSASISSTRSSRSTRST